MTENNPNEQSFVDPSDTSLEGRIKRLVRLMDQENLQELEVNDGDFQVKLSRTPPALPAAFPLPAPTRGTKAKSAPAKKESVPEEASNLTPIKSPLAGVFYRSPSPTSPPFVKEGDNVSPEKILCIVEAMKVLNEINAGLSGRIVKILLENGKPISTGQTLFLVDTTA